MSYKVAVYCGSSRKSNEFLLESAFLFGKALAENGIEIIYGGGKAGMMGALAYGALEADGRVTGVIPDFLQVLELGHDGIAELKIVDSMHTRQQKMMQLSDCIVALPGGCGTFAEIIEAIAWKKLGLITSPIIIANLNNYYDNLLAQFDTAIDSGFMNPGAGFVWHVTEDIQTTVDLIVGFKNRYNGFAVKNNILQKIIEYKP